MDAQTLILGATALVTAATPIMLAIINRRQAKADVATATKVDEVRADLQTKTDGVSEKLDKIDHNVNAERSAMIAELKAMHEKHIEELAKLNRVISDLTRDKATLEERQKGHDAP